MKQATKSLRACEHVFYIGRARFHYRVRSPPDRRTFPSGLPGYIGYTTNERDFDPNLSPGLSRLPGREIGRIELGLLLKTGNRNSGDWHYDVHGTGYLFVVNDRSLYPREAVHSPVVPTAKMEPKRIHGYRGVRPDRARLHLDPSDRSPGLRPRYQDVRTIPAPGNPGRWGDLAVIASHKMIDPDRNR